MIFIGESYIFTHHKSRGEMRRILALLATVATLTACAPTPQQQVSTTAQRETVLVHDSNTGNDLLMLCAIGIICNNGPILHTYTSYAPAPQTIVHVYSPASPTFYRSQPSYQTRVQTYTRSTPSYSAPSYSRPSTAAPQSRSTYSAPSYSRPSYSAPSRSYSTPSYSRPSSRPR